jgi:DDE superfamily endonuclease
MFTPPAEVSAVLAAFAPLFTEPSWARAQALLCGVLLAPANQTLTAALRALGLADEPGFQNYHRVLNRARWSARQAAHHLLKLLVEAFVPAGPVIIGLDDTVERRRGRKLTARAIYYDAARSSRSCFQKTSGLRWMNLALLVPVRSRGPGLGAALPDGAVSFGTLRPLRAPRPAAQAAGRARPRPHRSSAPLAARSDAGRGGR